MKRRLVTPEELAVWCDGEAERETGPRKRRFQQVALSLRAAAFAAQSNFDVVVAQQKSLRKYEQRDIRRRLPR